jgi:hypothetical protein
VRFPVKLTAMTDENPPDAARVAAVFGLGRPTGPMTPVARGAMGMVWRLTTDSGAWAAKSLFDWARDDRIEIEAKVTAAAIAAGVQTPSLVCSVEGRFIERIAGGRWRVFSWMDLGPTPPPTSVRACSATAT